MAKCLNSDSCLTHNESHFYISEISVWGVFLKLHPKHSLEETSPLGGPTTWARARSEYLNEILSQIVPLDPNNVALSQPQAEDRGPCFFTWILHDYECWILYCNLSSGSAFGGTTLSQISGKTNEIFHLLNIGGQVYGNWPTIFSFWDLWHLNLLYEICSVAPSVSSARTKIFSMSLLPVMMSSCKPTKSFSQPAPPSSAQCSGGIGTSIPSCTWKVRQSKTFFSSSQNFLKASSMPTLSPSWTLCTTARWMLRKKSSIPSLL